MDAERVGHKTSLRARASVVTVFKPVAVKLSPRAGLPQHPRQQPYGGTMSDLLPNLDSLLAQLTRENAGQRDARALAEAANRASTEQDLDAVIGEVIATWRRC